MKTENQIEKEFKKEFKALLVKYKASFEVDHTDFGASSTIYVDSIYNEDGELERKYSEFSMTYEDQY